MSDCRKKNISARDLILIGFFVLAGVVLLVCVKFGTETGSTAVVLIDGQVAGRYELSADGLYELNGGTNVLLIRDGRAAISAATCPDGLCMRMGFVSKTGESVICLPNRLVVVIEGKDTGDYDFVI